MMEHFYRELRGCMPGQLARFYARQVAECQDGSHFVEVGVYLGQSLSFLAVEAANSGKHIHIDGVDTWRLAESTERASREMAEIGIDSDESFYEAFLRGIEPVRHLVTPVRLPSLEAAALYADGTLDLVFIDAAHDAASVEQDARAWLPKVKGGGMLSGDDWQYRSVQIGLQKAGLRPENDGRVWWLRHG